MAETDFDAGLKEGGRDVPSGTAHADITRQTATALAPSALTSGVPAALTSAHAVGDPPTGAEFNLLQDDVAALRTNQTAIRADIVALRATVAAVVVDAAATIVKCNAILDTLDAFQETA